MVRRYCMFLIYILPFAGNCQDMYTNVYLGYNSSVLFQIPHHFKDVNAEFKQLYGEKFALSPFSRGLFVGVRITADDYPFGFEYTASRRVASSNVVFWPVENQYLKYRMRYGTHSVGFIFGMHDAKARFGVNYDFGNVTWEKKISESSNLLKTKWEDYVETTEIMWIKGPIYMGLNFYGIFRMKPFELRPFILLSLLKTEYHDYTNSIDYPIRMSHMGVAIYWSPEFSD